MVDVLRALDLVYCTSNPGLSFDGLQESIVNYGDNRMPEFLTCLHEESAVVTAHGYAKVEGKPMMALLLGTVGLQHATMAIYNAYADRAGRIAVGYEADLIVLDADPLTGIGAYQDVLVVINNGRVAVNRLEW